jgi:alkanesulfonate monooxygenase SsuD/methylene tetrahydromethanopterin reductase-like flavin-dependent oxidoreductase (luciferase family)
LTDGLPKFGVFVPNFGPFFDPSTLAELAVEAEQAGWDGFFLWDHIAYAESPPVVDPWVALAAIASATDRVRIGALITPVARRRPWKLARETVSLDHLSGGRLIFGAGLGWSAPVEFAAFGEPTDDRARAAILDEGLDVLDRLWSGEAVEFDGEHFQVSSAPFLPRPVQRPRIPVWVGGVWPRPRPFARAARWDGVFPELAGEATPAPEDVTAIERTIAERRELESPFDIAISGSSEAGAARAMLEPYDSTGLTWWMEKAGPGFRHSVDELRRRIDAGPVAT